MANSSRQHGLLVELAAILTAVKLEQVVALVAVSFKQSCKYGKQWILPNLAESHVMVHVLENRIDYGQICVCVCLSNFGHTAVVPVILIA